MGRPTPQRIEDDLEYGAISPPRARVRTPAAPPCGDAPRPKRLKHHLNELLFQPETPDAGALGDELDAPESTAHGSTPHDATPRQTAFDRAVSGETAPVEELRFIAFPPKLEATYQAVHQRRILPIFRFALLATAFFTLAYVLWDLFIYAPNVAETLPVRIVTAFANLGLWALTFHAVMRKRAAVLIYLAIFLGVLANSIVLVLLPNGFMYGLGGLFFYMLAIIAIAPNFRVAWRSSLLLIAVPNVLMLAGLSINATSWFVLVNADAFLIPLSLLACGLAFLIDQNYRRTFELELSLQRLATTDTLTGILNRRALLDRAEIEIARARRHGHNLCLLLLDIDRFKPVNDTYGHHAGDEVIRRLAMTTRSTLRDTDIFGRMGGEEFAALLPETDPIGALELAERVRRALECTVVPVDGALLHFTVSIGVACLTPLDDNVSSLLRRADEALYQAKHCGRNCVMPAS